MSLSLNGLYLPLRSKVLSLLRQKSHVQGPGEDGAVILDEVFMVFIGVFIIECIKHQGSLIM